MQNNQSSGLASAAHGGLGSSALQGKTSAGSSEHLIYDNEDNTSAPNIYQQFQFNQPPSIPPGGYTTQPSGYRLRPFIPMDGKMASGAYQCPHCERKCQSSNALENHIRVHTGEKPFGCPVEGCATRFKQKSQQYSHMRNRHFIDTNMLPKGRKGYMLPETMQEPMAMGGPPPHFIAKGMATLSNSGGPVASNFGLGQSIQHPQMPISQMPRMAMPNPVDNKALGYNPQTQFITKQEDSHMKSEQPMMMGMGMGMDQQQHQQQYKENMEPAPQPQRQYSPTAANSKIRQMFKQIDLNIEEIDDNINTFYQQNPKELQKLQEGNPLQVFRRQLGLSNINVQGQTDQLRDHKVNPRVFDDPINSEIYQGIVENTMGQIPIFSEMFF